jgi:virulence-associated protein VagC
MPGTEVLVRREGSHLVLEPLDANGLPIGFWNDIDRLMDGLEFPDPEPIGARLLDLRDDG